MAFSMEDKVTIVRLLGYSANMLNPSSIYYNNILDNRLLVVLQEAEDQAISLVERIRALDEKLEAAVDSTGVRRIDDIEFFSASEGNKVQELRKERSRVIRELAQLLDIPMMTSLNMGNISV